MTPSLLDPRTKMILTGSTAVILVTAERGLILLLSAGLLVAAALLLGLMRAWLKFFKGLGPAVAGFFVIAWLAFDLATALTAGLRLLALGTVFFLFFQTTPPTGLSKALVTMGLPYAFSFVLTVSMEFIPVLTRRAANIRDAQRARGIPLEGGLGTLRYLPALLGPLLIQSFKLADEMAEALEARGFGAAERRPRYETRFRWVDWVTVLMSLAGLIAFLLLKKIWLFALLGGWAQYMVESMDSKP
jgi:energy-coupling factor transport system permease protein